MRSALLGVVATLACGLHTAEPGPKAPDTPESPQPPPAAKQSEPVPPSLAAVDGWDPNTPVDTKKLKLHNTFVITASSAVCPTREQALARDCGNSVETKSKGTSEALGRRVTVVGDAPVDQMWKAIRFQKAGTLPGWIMADDVADRPRDDFLVAFEKRPELATAQDVGTLSSAQLSALSKDTIVHWTRTTAVKYGSFEDGGAYIYLDMKKTGTAAIRVPEPDGAESFIDNHSCLVNADCLWLDYVCNERHCDEVSILARATGKKVGPPEDEYSTWKATKGPMPVFEMIVIADRFGTFTREK